MAATLTPDGELTYFSFPIEKTVEDENGDIVVYGKATDGTLDSDLQIVDQDWSAKAIREWLDTGGNVRVQHQARRDPAGRGLDVEITPDGHFVKALIVEPVAKNLVRKRVLQDFSVGITLPDINPDPTGKAMNGIITGRRDGRTKISEISLVDRGSNFNSKFQLVKAAGDGAPEFVGKMSGGFEDFLAKSVDPDAEPRREDYPVGGAINATLTFSPADLAKMLTGHDGVAKRNMDPNVGGGVDRDTIPASDFAGEDRSFPIVTPKDVHDAALSIGRAGDDNASGGTLKKNIIRIARRKGASFVAELPESWKKELGMADTGKADAEVVDVAKTDDDAAAEKAGVPPQFLKDDDKDDDADEKDAKSKSDKAGVPPQFLKDDDKDEDDSDDDKPKPDKSTDADVEKAVGVEKKSKVMCPGCGANVHAEHNFCSECGGSLKKALAVKKNHDFTCLKCGMQLDKGEKFCPGCGKQHPGYLPEADSKVKAAGDEGSVDKVATKAAKKAAKAKLAKKATPTDAADEAADAEPVPAHREPDGPAIEAVEHDAGLPTTPDSTTKAADLFFPGDPEASASMRLKMLGVPVDFGVMHDLTCPCFHPDDVAKSYPQTDLSGLDVDHWQARAFDMAAAAPLSEAHKANRLYQNAAVLKATDPRDLMEVRSDLYKEFRDANPGPGSYPTPGAISPRSFNHPVLTAGHEAPSPGHSGPNTASMSFGEISAAQYGRGHLSGDHASESPASAGVPARSVSAPAITGVPTRTHYTNAQRENARQAMVAMHDHIAQTFPDLCPAYTTAGPYHSDTLPGSRSVPTGVGMPSPHGATKAKKSKKNKAVDVAPEAVVDKAATVEVVEKAAVLDLDAVQAMVTKAVVDANAARDAEVAALTKSLRKARKQLDVIAEQPDPNAPYRGVAFDQISKTAAAPAVLPSVARVERAQQNMYEFFHNQWRNNPDPMQREVAYRELVKMNGFDNPTFQ